MQQAVGGRTHRFRALRALPDAEALRRDAQAALRAAGGTAPEPPYVGGGDDVVAVSVDEDGRIVAVEVAPDWPERIAAADVAAAVFAAYGEAQVQAAEAIATRRLALDGMVASGADGMRVDGVRADTPDWLDADIDTWLWHVRATLDGVEDTLDRADRRLRTPPADVASPGGCFTLRLEHGIPVALSGITERIAAADAARLRREIIDVFDAARRVSPQAAGRPQ